MPRDEPGPGSVHGQGIQVGNNNYQHNEFHSSYNRPPELVCDEHLRLAEGFCLEHPQIPICDRCDDRCSACRDAERWQWEAQAEARARRAEQERQAHEARVASNTARYPAQQQFYADELNRVSTDLDRLSYQVSRDYRRDRGYFPTPARGCLHFLVRLAWLIIMINVTVQLLRVSRNIPYVIFVALLVLFLWLRLDRPLVRLHRKRQIPDLARRKAALIPVVGCGLPDCRFGCQRADGQSAPRA
jgi:hypothetical protein